MKDPAIDTVIAQAEQAGVEMKPTDNAPKKSAEDKKFEQEDSARKFKFLELSREIERLCGNFVEVMRPLDVMEDWDILTEEGFEKAKSAHTTPTWPSLTSSKSRWTWVSACDSIGRSTGRLGALHGRRGKPRPRESDRPDLLDRGGGQNVVPAECHMPGNSRR